MATPDLLSRNLPTHADEIGEFVGGTDEFPWGTGDIASDVGVKADVDLVTTTSDQESTIRLKKPAHVQHWPRTPSINVTSLLGHNYKRTRQSIPIDALYHLYFIIVSTTRVHSAPIGCWCSFVQCVVNRDSYI
eukprot:SAG31_NODE_518_length_14674_cov_39.604803_2_plen_133_part_00